MTIPRMYSVVHRVIRRYGFLHQSATTVAMFPGMRSMRHFALTVVMLSGLPITAQTPKKVTLSPVMQVKLFPDYTWIFVPGSDTLLTGDVTVELENGRSVVIGTGNSWYFSDGRDRGNEVGEVEMHSVYATGSARRQDYTQAYQAARKEAVRRLALQLRSVGSATNFTDSMLVWCIDRQKLDEEIGKRNFGAWDVTVKLLAVKEEIGEIIRCSGNGN